MTIESPKTDTQAVRDYIYDMLAQLAELARRCEQEELHTQLAAIVQDRRDSLIDRAPYHSRFLS